MVGHRSVYLDMVIVVIVVVVVVVAVVVMVAVVVVVVVVVVVYQRFGSSKTSLRSCTRSLPPSLPYAKCPTIFVVV